MSKCDKCGCDTEQFRAFAKSLIDFADCADEKNEIKKPPTTKEIAEEALLKIAAAWGKK